MALEKVNEKVNGVLETLKYGASEGTRTLDLRFTKPMLYQLSYAGCLPAACGRNCKIQELVLVRQVVRQRQLCASAIPTAV